MKQVKFVAVIIIIMFISGCYSSIRGRVVDGVSGKPIENALVLVQWTKEHGLGDTYRSLYKVVETLTDKDGNFVVDGVYEPFVKPPQMLIYKEGYVPWRNDMVFPVLAFVKDNEWKNNVTYRLDYLTKGYTYDQISSFISHYIYHLVHTKAPIYDNIYDNLSNKMIIENRKRDK